MADGELSPRCAGLWKYLSKVAGDLIPAGAMDPFAVLIQRDGKTSILDTGLLQASGGKGLVANQRLRWLEDQIRAQGEGLAAAGLVYEATMRPQEGGTPTDALVAHLEERDGPHLRLIAPYTVEKGRVKVLAPSRAVLTPNTRWLT